MARPKKEKKESDEPVLEEKIQEDNAEAKQDAQKQGDEDLKSHPKFAKFKGEK